MENAQWLLCPACRGKTRTRIREDTKLVNFPLFCPKCKRETLVDVLQMNIQVHEEPGAETRSQMEQNR